MGIENEPEFRYACSMKSTAKPSNVDRIARVPVALNHMKPAIWRRVEVPLTTSLRGLHEVIQAAMLFENYHLFQFDVIVADETRHYGMPDPDGDDWIKIVDAKNVKLGSLVERDVKLLSYTYEFGDNWEHTITIEETGMADPAIDYPRFIEGERRAPPEDVGGIPGFEGFLDAMKKPRHPERKQMLEWYGGVFQPEEIDAPKITRNIAKLAHRRAIGKAAFAKSKGRTS